MAGATKTRKKSAATKRKPAVPFFRKLVVFQWLMGLFGLQRFEELSAHLKSEDLVGVDENNIHHFHHVLVAQLPGLDALPPSLLLEYDQNIVSHSQRLNEGRLTRGEDPIVWKYFQYLILLFTEIYLDRYFTDAKALLLALNEEIRSYNADVPASDQLSLFLEDEEAWPQLNKLACWSATGSGKTLLMHMNILQYRHYMEKHGRLADLNHVILLTPNEGLSNQHMGEFAKAGIPAELFSKKGPTIFTNHAIEVLDIYKLREEMGDKTIAVDSFEGNNLVLIDEGHRGTSAGVEGAWMRFRNALCEKGFSFEYSATFGQAVKGNEVLTDSYAKSVLFDYSYRYFYGDGFGKDYHILNLDRETEESQRELYLVACLLTFFQQQRLYQERGASFAQFNIAKPLWVFVGGKVTATLAAQDASDIIEILRFLARFTANPAESSALIGRVLTQGLQTTSGRNLFAGRFGYLIELGLSPDDVFRETMTSLFNAPSGGSFYVENLRGVSGEIALRVGDNEAFGVINVGDDAKLVKLCEEWDEFVVAEREFSESLFEELNSKHSSVHVLIGAKKFTEGWNSWRVSTMGLMNVGASEGSQIIQLFGRGIRLQGHGITLKRSNAVQLPAGVERPQHIQSLETLAVFGIHADYMAQFRDFLHDEGLPSNQEQIELLLPVLRNLGKHPLKMIRLQDSIGGMTPGPDAFRKMGPSHTLDVPTAGEASHEYLTKNQVILNWYPKIDAMRSGESAYAENHAINETHLTPKHVAMLDLDYLYLELRRFKSERGWHNITIVPTRLEGLLLDQSWYRIQIPAGELAFDSFEKVRIWQEIAGSLLKKYVERFYRYMRQEWELPHLEYRELSLDDPNFVGAGEPGESFYRIVLEESQQEIAAKLGQLKDMIERKELKPWEFQGLKAIWFSQHLYQPLLYAEKKLIEISPVPLNSGEAKFVEDLKSFYDANLGFFEERELYLLRNLSRGRGIGFFEAGNFHPDFIIWLLSDEGQRVVFVDPKGIRNVVKADPKIRFHETIKVIEERLGDSEVSLHSFIVSNTPSHVMSPKWELDKEEMKDRHVLFQEEDADTYIREMLDRVG